MLLWFVASALAGTSALEVCCSEAGTSSCPSTLSAIGPGAQSRASGDAWEVRGVWELSCDRAPRFSPTAQRTTTRTPAAGAVLDSISFEGAACFDAACWLPEELCVGVVEEAVQVVHCATGTPASEGVWTETRKRAGRAVITDGHPIRARQVPPGALLGAVGPVPSASTAAPRPAPASDPPPTPASAAPRPAPAAAPRPEPAATLSPKDLEIPDPPPDPCVTRSTLRQPSNQQVDLGNEAMIHGDRAAALGHYRAAIAVNRCNAFAWASLGDALLGAGGPEAALEALASATTLMPTHFQAWTSRGRAAEALGRYADAAEAYGEALASRPGFGPAEAGLARTTGR